MVGTLLKMITSPNIKPLDERKTPPRRSPIQASIKRPNDYDNQNESTDHKEDGMLLRLGQNGGTKDHETVGMFEDDEVDGDVTDGGSTTFQCACKVWSCTQCHKAFSSARALKIHEVKQHENMPKQYIKCNHCDEVFDHGNLLQIHMKVHHNIKVQCTQCKDLPKPVNSKGHHAEPMCPVCGVKFDHDKLLKLHMEHYHKVSRNDSLPTEGGALQQTLQPVSTLLSPNSRSMDSRSLSPDSRKQTPSPRQMESHFNRLFYEGNSDDSNSRSSVSPRELLSDREGCDGKQMFDRQFTNELYVQRPVLAVPQSGYYHPFHDNGPLHHGAMSFYPQGVRRNIEKRPLGRSHSLPLKQDTVYADIPLMPWQIPDTGYPGMYGMSREKKIDRAALEAMRNSLKAKLRSVEETLLREETESHKPLSPTLHSLYDNPRYFGGREEDAAYPHRPSVITPRNSFGGFPYKRHAPPSDLEPFEKIRALDKDRDASLSPSRSPNRLLTSFIPCVKESVIPRIYEPQDVPIKVSRDDLAIPNLQREYFDNQAKIFVKRGAPRCNRCQQTFCSKMEYLHHLISHREKDGLIDASPEEMEFIEDVKRSMDSKNFAEGEMMENHYRKASTNSSESSSPQDKITLEGKEQNSDAQPDSVSEDKSSLSSPSVENTGPVPLQTECVECKDVFADSASYQVHVEKRHMKPRCRECGLTFDHKNLLKIHMDCYHSTLEVLQCYYCGMSFKHRGAFLDHVTSHESQDISNKERMNEQNSEPTEQGGRRRWGRLVASAQLPAEKLDVLGGGGHNGAEQRLGVRDVLALKSNTKQKLRKTVSLSAYTDMINRQKKSHSQFLQETRSKGDEAIGKEMRTRIFLPFQDKMENLSRFASSSVQLAKKRISPPPQEKPVQGNGDYIFHRQNHPADPEGGRPSYYNDEGKAAYAPADGKAFPYVAQKRKLERLKRSMPVDEAMKPTPLGFPLRKAFVRDDVENIYQMRHKKAFQRSDLSKSLVPDPLDHRNALVKIERVEVDPAPRQASPQEPSKSELGERVICAKQHASIPDNTDTSITSLTNSSIKHVAQPKTSTIEPPPLINVRHTQSSSVTTATDLNTSTRAGTPCASPGSFESKAKPDTSPSSPLTGELSEKETKGKQRNSIKRLTKEALINSLSLKRRSSAPDLYQLHHDQPNESTQDEKATTAKRDCSPGSPMPESEQTASPSKDTKHHGSRSLYYTPRKQSDRDVTCVQCGVSFGHKKLYKIHLDSYHGQQAEHECLQCGEKNFKNKDHFVKHLMAHENKGKSSDIFLHQDSPATDQEFDGKKEIHSDLSYSHQLSPNIRKLKASLGEGSEFASSDEERSNFLSHTSNSKQLESKDNLKVGNNLKGSVNKKTTCLLCGKMFENGKQLEQHFSSHAMISEDGRFCCVICNKAFETLRKLEVHSRSHTGFKPHKCEQCGRCFPYYSSYYYHKMTHTKDRPHKCPVCGKGFIQTRYLRSHLATHKDEQGSMSDEVELIIKKAELTMNDETDEESVDSPGTAEGSPGYQANDEETATAEILCSFKRGLSCSGQNSESELSPAMPLSCTSGDN